jgi:DNA-binding transcriptional MerR regulator
MTGTYTIGQMSRRTGVKVTTIRYYEQSGLLSEPQRAASGHRRYDDAALERLGFIRQARLLGFEPTAIRELLDLSANPDRPCEAIDAIAKRHAKDVENRIQQLSALKAELERVIDDCGHQQVGDCNVLQAIASRMPDPN